MAEKTRAELSAQAQEIRNETQTGANTAVRVGQMLQDLVDSQTNQEDQNVDQRLPVYNAQDAYEMPDNSLGHSVDIGMELYLPCVNQSSQTVTVEAPKVFLIGKSNATDFKLYDATVAGSGDLSTGSMYGLNTNAAAVGERVDVVLFGRLNNIDTSTWFLGQLLWVATDGSITGTRPAENAFPIARVEKVGLTDGALLCIASSAGRVDIVGVAAGSQRSYFTGETEVTTEGTFYKALPDDKGTVATVQQTITVNDDSTGAFPQDLLGVVTTVSSIFRKGLYVGVLEIETDGSQAFDKYTVEYYLADSQGVVEDPGNGEPNGALGVPPLIVLDSPLVDGPANVSQFILTDGRNNTDVSIPAGKRVRVHVMASKVGTQGSAKDYTVYYGSDHLSFVDAPLPVKLGDLSDVEDTASDGDILRYSGVDSIWYSHSGNIDTTRPASDLADVAAYSNLQVGDYLTWNGSFWENQPAIPSSGIQPEDGLTEDKTFPANTARTYQVLTQAEYDGIGTKDAETLYFIVA